MAFKWIATVHSKRYGDEILGIFDTEAAAMLYCSQNQELIESTFEVDITNVSDCSIDALPYFSNQAFSF